MEIGKIVGKKIKKYRERTGKTQLHFALDTYMSPSYIRRFDRGIVTNPTKATLEHIAKSLGTTLEELIHEEEEQHAGTKGEARQEDYRPLSYDDYLKFQEQYRKMPAGRQRQLRIILNALFMDIQ